MRWTALVLVWVFGLIVLIPSVFMWLAYSLDESITGTANSIDSKLLAVIIIVPIVLVFYTIRVLRDKKR